MPEVSGGSLSQCCQCLSPIRQTKLTKVHFKTPELVFTALHGMQTRSCDEISVRPSVRLSNACIVTKRKKSQSRFFIPCD